MEWDWDWNGIHFGIMIGVQSEIEEGTGMGFILGLGF